MESVISGRRLSGVFCPECEAEFSLADLKQLNCSICGAKFTPERMANLIRRADFEKARGASESRETALGEKNWPEDAPLW